MNVLNSEISDFDHFMNILKSNWKMIFRCQLFSCQLFSCFEWFLKVWHCVKILSHLKFLLTAVISEISDFDNFLNILKSNWKVIF